MNFKRCDFMSFISLSSQWRRNPMGFLNQTEVCWKNGCRNRSTCTNNKSNCCLLQNIDLEPGERSNRASIRFQYELWWDCQTWRENLKIKLFDWFSNFGWVPIHTMILYPNLWCFSLQLWCSLNAVRNPQIRWLDDQPNNAVRSKFQWRLQLRLAAFSWQEH